MLLLTAPRSNSVDWIYVCKCDVIFVLLCWNEQVYLQQYPIRELSRKSEKIANKQEHLQKKKWHVLEICTDLLNCPLKTHFGIIKYANRIVICKRRQIIKSSSLCGKTNSFQIEISENPEISFLRNAVVGWLFVCIRSPWAWAAMLTWPKRILIDLFIGLITQHAPQTVECIWFYQKEPVACTIFGCMEQWHGRCCLFMLY